MTSYTNQEKGPEVRHDTSCVGRGRLRFPFVLAAAAAAASTCAPSSAASSPTSTPFAAAPGPRRGFRIPAWFISLRGPSSRSSLAHYWSARTPFTFESAAGPTRTDPRARPRLQGPGRVQVGPLGSATKSDAGPLRFGRSTATAAIVVAVLPTVAAGPVGCGAVARAN